ncbi:MAG: sulfite exporter TauE/SafE family protein [Comamonadaceae bacterium]|nr:MAG: sulfite exporter TauE/SafE family protein [Comamonadaceae bacterium]
MGLSKSGFGAGFGSLAVPLMALACTVPQAAAIMMPLLLVMDLLGIAAFRREVDWRLLRFLLPWALGQEQQREDADDAGHQPRVEQLERQRADHRAHQPEGNQEAQQDLPINTYYLRI